MAMVVYCPLCDDKQVSSKLVSMGGIGQRCEREASHVFQDMQELQALRPRTEMIKSAPVIKPDEMVLPLHLHKSLIEALQKRFGEKLERTAAALLEAMLDPDAFMVAGREAKDIRDRLGKKISNSQEMTGLLFSQSTALAEAEERLQQKKISPYGTVSGSEVTFVAVDRQDVEVLEGKAKILNKPVAKLVAEFMHHAIKNNWLK